MSNVYKMTPLRIVLNSNDPYLGVTTERYKTVVPMTPTSAKRWGVELLTTEIHNVCKDSRLRPYQIEDVNFHVARKNSAIFNEQRTGKTPTALVTMKLRGCEKILIVCPASLVPVWVQEFKQWYGGECIGCYGTQKEKTFALANWTQGLVVSYETLRSSVWLQSILKENPDGCIIDEAHRVRNHKSKTAREAVFKLSKIPNKLALTGTPSLRKPEEIFSILHFLYPLLFKGKSRFLDYYFKPSYKDIWIAREKKTVISGWELQKEQELQELLDNISTQRKRKEVMQWLPEKDRRTIELPLTPRQNKMITELREDFETEGIMTQGILDTIIRERQICLHPCLPTAQRTDSLDFALSPKLNFIIDYIRDNPEKQIIIFSSFTAWLHVIKDTLHYEINNNSCKMIAGDVQLDDRKKAVKDFQDGVINYLCINTQAGKEGLTLDNADTIIFTDQYPPMGDILQAEDRMVATAKEKVKDNQVIYNLVMKDSFEINIDAALKKSASEIDLINDYNKYLRR